MTFRIVQHCFGKPNSGGPIKALDRILNSKLASEIDFHTLTQENPARGLNIRLIHDFSRRLKALKPDLIHVRGLGNEGFHGVLAAKLASVPNILLSVHGTVRDLQTQKYGVRRAIVRDLLEPISLNLATHLMTVCEHASGREFLKSYQSKLVGVVPNGVELPLINNHKRNFNRREMGIAKEDVIAVCVSRLTSEKGYFVLANAVRRLSQFHGNLKLWIIGNGPDRTLIEKEFTNSSIDVHFFGHRDDVDSLLELADLFVFPTLHENLSNALLEAMSHALPVVASAVGGNVEVLSHGGGKLIPPSDSEALASAISDYVSNPQLRQIDGSMARKVVTEHYTVQQMVNKLGSIYRKILN